MGTARNLGRCKTGNWSYGKHGRFTSGVDRRITLFFSGRGQVNQQPASSCFLVIGLVRRVGRLAASPIEIETDDRWDKIDVHDMASLQSKTKDPVSVCLSVMSRKQEG